MTTRDTVDAVKRAHSAVHRAHATLKFATARRDAAVVGAQSLGVSDIEIADALVIPRQQVQEITEAAMHELRAEVSTTGVQYADLVEDDQQHVDWVALDLAKKRGGVMPTRSRT